MPALLAPALAGALLLPAAAEIPVAFVPPSRPAAAAPEPEGGRAVDFRFAPPRWQTSICLPDDPSKTLVDSEGRLLYEFGGGPFDGFHTRVGVRPGAGAKLEGNLRQRLLEPRVPLAITEGEAGGMKLRLEAFAAAPVASAAAEPPPRLERVDGDDGQRGWAAPAAPCDPVFRDVAIGWNRSIEYRFRSEIGREYQVVFGLCEGHHGEPGRRVEELRIEGKVRRTVDPVREAGKNAPAAIVLPAKDEDGDGWILIAVAAAPEASDKNTILNALWIFEGDAPQPREIVRGELRRRPIAFAAGPGPERLGPAGSGREDVLAVRIENPGSAPKGLPVEILVESTRKIEVDRDRARVLLDGRSFLALDPPPSSARIEERKLVLEYGGEEVPPGGARRIAATVLLGSRAEGIAAGRIDEVRERAIAYWRGLPLPWDRIAVSDPGVQALLDSCVRNIYQAREIKKGLPAFQVGPTVYRGLWVVDGSFLLEAASYLGRLDEARSGLDYLLTFQKPDGSVQIIEGHWKETGIALWALSRHAQLTGDRAWIEKLWPRVVRAVDHLRDLRARSRKDPSAPEAGLIPRGFSDGGLGGPSPEYTNVYWNLVGLRAIARIAEQLGKPEAKAWQDEYRDFFAAYRRAAERDLGTDARGNRYVPIVMKGGPPASPQRAQWAFLHAVFPGKIFEREDPLAAGTLAMLTATEREGLIFGTGWIADGIWNYAGSFYGHAHLWMGNGPKAADILYAFANHASPLLCWREEQMPRGGGPNVVGDMPHNWASAEFIRLVRHLLVLERGDELHLLEGLPAAWALRGGALRLKEIATEFGPVTLEMDFSPGGKAAKLRIVPPARTPPARIAVHLESWAGPEMRAKAGGRTLDIERPGLTAAPGKALEIDLSAGE